MRLLSRPLILLILLGIAVAVVGLAVSSIPTLVIGAILAIVGALGEGLTDLDISFPGGGQMKLKREPVAAAIQAQAQTHGITEDQARKIAHDAARELLPPQGANIVISKSGGASARVRGGGTLTVQVPPGGNAAKALAEEAAKHFYLCERCGFHAPVGTVGLADGAYCPACGHGRLETI
jgi:hypothetical protein